MPWLIPKALPDQGERQVQRFLGDLAERLDDAGTERDEVVREVLAQMMHARPFSELEETSPLAALALDPRNVTLEAERYAATDAERFARVKPLLWLWKCLDLTPFGQSLATGLPLRRLLAERIFARAGRNLKIFQNVEVSVGYNIEAGDDVVIHRHVLIDDIGGVELHDGCSISDYANVYSHTHDVLEAADVRLRKTVIGRGVRVAYHATVLAGTVLSDDSMLGAMALATRDLAPHVIGLGVPARPRVWKERAGDPEFQDLRVNAADYPRSPELRANPDFLPAKDADED